LRSSPDAVVPAPNFSEIYRSTQRAGPIAASADDDPDVLETLLVRQVGRTIIEVQDPPLAGPLATEKRVIRASQEFILVDLGAVIVGGGHTEGRTHDAVLVDGLARQGL